MFALFIVSSTLNSVMNLPIRKCGILSGFIQEVSEKSKIGSFFIILETGALGASIGYPFAIISS